MPCPGALLAIAATGAPAPRQPVGAGCVRAGAVSYDERSMIFDGQRQLMLSGAIHFARVMPQDWNRVLGMAADMGLAHGCDGKEEQATSLEHRGAASNKEGRPGGRRKAHTSFNARTFTHASSRFLSGGVSLANLF